MTIAVDIAPGKYSTAVATRLEKWSSVSFAERLWDKDPTLWFEEPTDEIADRLGWLDLPDRIPRIAAALARFRSQVRDEDFKHVIVLGMGGSSLAPEVFQNIFGNSEGFPRLLVLDSTHPAAIRSLEDRIELKKALFVVSSKSGTTVETLSFLRYFWQEVAAGKSDPGRHFVAVTDPDSYLDALAAERSFRAIFHAPTDVGGRYSALTEFGLVPAAAIGVDLGRLHDGADRAASLCGPDVAESQNPALVLGAFLGELAKAGQDKATFVASSRLRPLVPWIEQLVAESTGKDGMGIVPIGGDEDALRMGDDRAMVVLETRGAELDIESTIADRPVARLQVGDVHDVGGAMFVLEMAVATAGAILGIHPFNQPDVQLAKALAREAMAGALEDGVVAETDVLDPDLSRHVSTWLNRAVPTRYVSIQAYLPPTGAVAAGLEAMRKLIRDGSGAATTFAFGPRFLHSTGQLHKGGPPGLFLQIVDHPTERLTVPESQFTFDALISAQALGDYHALQRRHQDVLRVNLGKSGASGLEALLTAVADAVQA